MERFNVNETLKSLSQFDLLGKKGDSLNERAFIYNLIYNNHLMWLENIVSNLFIIKGLPQYEIRNEREGIIRKKIRSTFVEFMLSYEGIIAVSYDAERGVIITPCTILDTLNLYGDPVRIQLSPPYNTSFDFFTITNRELDIRKDKFVVIRNDNMGNGFAPIILQTAKLLTSVLMCSITNAESQKFPIVIYGNTDTKISLEVVQNKIDAYEQYIQIKDNGVLDMDKIQILNKDMPYVSDKLMGFYQNILDNFFMRIGINSIMREKKERMITDEVNANNQAVRTSGDVYLINRQEGWEEVNHMFGMNVQVERNNDFVESLKNDYPYNMDNLFQKRSENNE